MIYGSGPSNGEIIGALAAVAVVLSILVLLGCWWLWASAYAAGVQDGAEAAYIEHGLAEYYLDENHERRFRLKEASDE